LNPTVSPSNFFAFSKTKKTNNKTIQQIKKKKKKKEKRKRKKCETRKFHTKPSLGLINLGSLFKVLALFLSLSLSHTHIHNNTHTLHNFSLFIKAVWSQSLPEPPNTSRCLSYSLSLSLSLLLFDSSQGTSPNPSSNPLQI